MNQTTQQFLQLVDTAIDVAEKRITLRDTGAPDTAPPGALENIVEALIRLKNKVVAGTLEPSNGVVTIGLVREVGDWEPWQSELFQAAKAIERYYLTNM